MIVVVRGDTSRACFGDVTATRWHARRLGGVVIDGALRDVEGIHGVGFPAFARGATPRTFHYPSGLEHGAVNVPVACGGALVRPGDVVVGDADGVVVVPAEAAAEVAAAATAYLAKENAKKAVFARERDQTPEHASRIPSDELRRLGYRFV